MIQLQTMLLSPQKLIMNYVYQKGCLEPNAANFNPNALDSTGVICLIEVIGCTDANLFKFNQMLI